MMIKPTLLFSPVAPPAQCQIVSNQITRANPLVRFNCDQPVTLSPACTIAIDSAEYGLSSIQVSGTSFAVSVDASLLALGDAYAVTATNCGVQASGAILLASGK